MDERKTLLVVDDEPANLQVLKNILASDYRLLFARDGSRAITLANTEKPDLILLDIMMPGLSGYEVIQQLSAAPDTKHIPVIFVTALSDTKDETQGFELGAVDFITKPVSPPIVRARVKNQLSLVKMDELKSTRLAVVQKLSRATEYKDNETGHHVIRMSHYAYTIARAAGYSPAWSETLLHAAPMHDIGKIGIPDHILQKKGALSGEEWKIMQRHTLIGAEILGNDTSELMQMAKNIAVYHHEKWDGTGYPYGLQTDAIPIEARITAIADVFDALTSQRPYKPAWSIEDASDYICKNSGTHFDPILVEAFNRCLPELLDFKKKWPE